MSAVPASSGNLMMEEPYRIDSLFRHHTSRDETSTKQWADAYLAAFAITVKVRVVTFDRALAGKVKGAVLLN